MIFMWWTFNGFETQCICFAYVQQFIFFILGYGQQNFGGQGT